MRRAAKQDKNAAELVEYARKQGMLVEYIGLPVDLLVGHKGNFYPVEIKGKEGTYTAEQQRFMCKCKLHALPFTTWRTTGDIDEFMTR
jgi:hypothetical protein